VCVCVQWGSGVVGGEVGGVVGGVAGCKRGLGCNCKLSFARFFPSAPRHVRLRIALWQVLN